MSARFESLDAGTGVFVFPDDPFDGLVAALDMLLDERERRVSSEAAYVSGLQRLIEEAPISSTRTPISRTRGSSKANQRRRWTRAWQAWLAPTG